jgi:hypothetical protein
MNLFSLMAHHGYALTFGLLLAEAIGSSLPGCDRAGGGGAAVAAHALWGPYVVITAVDGFDAWRLRTVLAGQIYGLGCCWDFYAASRSIRKPAFCDLLSRSTSAAKSHWLIAKFIPWRQYHGGTAGRQHEDALLAVSALGFRWGLALRDQLPCCWGMYLATF